jgi:hypothetical protein
MNASCHCGTVRVELAHKPDFINLCDCSLCLKSGGAWGYFTRSQVRIDGQTHGYQRADYKTPAVEIQFCPTCGTTTHWTLTEHLDEDRVGVNMRIFEPAELIDIETRTLDGRNWFGDGDAVHRRAVGKLGKDIFL